MNIEEYLYFKTPVGGVLAIPESYSPSNFIYVNKSELRNRSTDYILNVWGNRGGNTSPYNVCKALHKNEDIDVCIGAAWDTWVNSLQNGGVRGFVSDDSEGNRLTYSACWIASEGGKILDFDKKYFAGYYPESDTQGKCYGKPYQIEVPEDKKNKEGGEYETDIKFFISLPLNK